MKTKCMLALAIGALFMVSETSFAAPNINNIKAKTFRVAAIWPKSHATEVTFTQYFMHQVTKMTDGKIKFNYYPGGQLGEASDMLSLLKGGVADISLVAPPYMPDKLPLSNVPAIPGMFPSLCVGAMAFYHETQPGEYLYEHEIKQHGLHIFAAGVSPPYQVLTVDKPINNLSSVKGLKLKAAGGAQSDAVRKLGAVPVQLVSTALYSALKRGTLDGRVGFYQTLVSLNVADTLQYGTTGANVGSFTVMLGMASRKWNSLSPDLQDVLTKAGRKASLHSCSTIAQKEGNARKMLVKKYGWHIHHLNNKEKQKWAEKVAPVKKEWADKLNEKYGDHVGTNAIKSYERAVKVTEKRLGTSATGTTRN